MRPHIALRCRVSVTLLSRADVVPCKAATDLVKGRAWPDTEGVTGSNPVAPTSKALTSGNAAEPSISNGPQRAREHFTVWEEFSFNDERDALTYAQSLMQSVTAFMDEVLTAFEDNVPARVRA
jgi:hypothetical protein